MIMELFLPIYHLEKFRLFIMAGCVTLENAFLFGVAKKHKTRICILKIYTKDAFGIVFRYRKWVVTQL